MTAFADQLLGDEELEALFSSAADLDATVRFEIALAQAEAEHQVIDKAASEAISEKLAGFEADQAALTSATVRDGVPVPELVRQMRDHVGEPYSSAVHFGATSQDAVDTSLVLRLQKAVELLVTRLSALIDQIDDLIDAHGDSNLTGRTRMQKAIAITVQDRLVNWKTPLQAHRLRLEEIKPRLLLLQFGGAVGTLDRLGFKGAEVKKSLAEALGLGFSHANWHTRRDSIAEFAGWLSMVSGSLGKIGQDVALMAQNERNEIALSSGGGSSAMAHKQNPVAAETLVTLARFNAGLLGTLHQALVHEQERSGAAWTLEWLVLPKMTVATGASLLRAAELLDSVTRMGD